MTLADLKNCVNVSPQGSQTIVPQTSVGGSLEAKVFPFAKVAPDNKQISQVFCVTAVATKGSRPVEERAQAVLVREKFLRLASRFDSETKFISDGNKIIHHPQYQEIIKLGHDVVPYLLRDLNEHPGRWLWALHCITGADPIPPSALGKVRKMAAAWYEWGRQKGFV